jgi:thiaminase/transcriptional activator TenA
MSASLCRSKVTDLEEERGDRSGFTGELWRAIEPIYEQILVHPFLTGLTDGTLSREQFQHYAVQDALYLRDFARTLSIAAARAPAVNVLTMFADHVVTTMAAEGSLHDAFFAEFGLTRDQVERTPPAPTTLAYTSYMLRVATLADYAQVLGVALPCYWIYQEIGKVLLAHGSPDPLYRHWIETYGGEEYAAVVEAVLTEVDRVGEGLTPAQKAAVQEVFVAASRYEWMFWEMGWTLEQWPI